LLLGRRLLAVLLRQTRGARDQHQPRRRLRPARLRLE
jgi:hypothetical protein